MLMQAGFRVLSETLSSQGRPSTLPAALSLRLAFSPQYSPLNYHSSCRGFLSAFGVAAENTVPGMCQVLTMHLSPCPL